MAAKELKVKITADNKDLKKVLGDSEKQVNNFSGVVKKAGVALIGAFAAKQVLSGIKNMVVELGNMADRLLDLEQITGINVERLQEYEFVTKIAGVNSEAFANAVQGLTQRLARSEGEASPLNKALKQLGIEARTSNGELRNAADILDEAIAGLADMENITQRNVLGAQLFAGAWKDMAPILALGTKGIADARREARELGAVLDKEALEAANKFRIETERLNTQLEVWKRNLGMAIIPSLTTFAGQLNGFFKDVFTETNMSKLEKFGRLLAGSVVEIVTGGRFGKGITDPIFFEAWAKQAENALTPIEKLNQKIGELATKINAAQDAGIASREIAEAEKEFNRLVAERARLRKEEEDAAAAAAAAAAAEQKRIEEERRAALGELGRLREDLAVAEKKFVEANNEAERARHLLRMNNIKAEIEALEMGAKEALIRSMTGGATVPQRMVSLPGTIDIPPPPTAELNEFNNTLNETALAQLRAAEAAKKHAEMMESLKWIAEDAAYSIGEAFGQMATKGGQATAKLIAQAIAQAVSALIAKIATTVPFPASLALIAGAGAFSGIMKSQIPAFADGGMAFGPTLGLMGEYANARTNPEVIAPLDKLQSMLGGGVGEVEFKIRGDVMYGVLKRYEGRLRQNA